MRLIDFVSHTYSDPDIRWEWQWELLSEHQAITMQDIDTHPHLPWEWERVSTNPNLTMQFILDHPDKPWDWQWISENPSITLQDMQSHPTKPWDWLCMLRNPSISMSFVLDYTKSNQLTYEEWLYMLRNPGIPIQDILAQHTPALSDWMILSTHPRLTMEVLKSYPDPLHSERFMTYLSSHPNITMKDITENPDLPWDWEWISANPNLTMDFVFAHPTKPWGWYRIVQNPNISIQDIQRIKERCPTSSMWNGISRHPNCTIDILQTNPDFSWEWALMSTNPNITTDMVVTHPEADIHGHHKLPIEWNSFTLETMRATYTTCMDSVCDWICPFTSVL